MPPPPGGCVWCGRTGCDREHIIGKQIAKALGVPYPVTMSWGDHNRPGTSGEIILEDRVCTTCNKNWMRKLDNKMMKFMRDTFHHEARVQLDGRQQAVLAFWATKVALLFELWFHDEALRQPEIAGMGHGYIPADNLSWIGTRHKPPSHTQVWLGAIDPHTWSATHIFSVASKIVTLDKPSASPVVVPTTHGYHALFSLGRLVFYVVGWELSYDGERPDLSPDLILPGAMQRICPQRESVAEWPPKRMLDPKDLVRFMDTPADGGRPPEGWNGPMGMASVG